jgi:hypothetical protein
VDDGAPGSPSYGYAGPARPWIFFAGLYTMFHVVLFTIFPEIFSLSTPAVRPPNSLLRICFGLSCITLCIWLGYYTYYTSQLYRFSLRQAREVATNAARLNALMWGALLFVSFVAAVTVTSQIRKLHSKQACSKVSNTFKLSPHCIDI